MRTNRKVTMSRVRGLNVVFQEQLDLDMSDPLYRQFNKIFQAFKIQETEPKEVVKEAEEV